MNTLFKNFAFGFVVLVTAGCATTKLPEDNIELIQIITPFNDLPYREKCQDLGFVTGHANDNGALIGVIDVKNQAQKLGANVILSRPEYADGFTRRGFAPQGFALKCPEALLPKGEDRWAKDIRENRKAWKTR